MPVLYQLCYAKDRMMEEHKYQQVRIGAAGGIGTPQSAAAALLWEQNTL